MTQSGSPPPAAGNQFMRFLPLVDAVIWWGIEVGLTLLLVVLVLLKVAIQELHLPISRAICLTFGTGDLFVYCMVLLASTAGFCVNHFAIHCHREVNNGPDDKLNQRRVRFLVCGFLGFAMLPFLYHAAKVNVLPRGESNRPTSAPASGNYSNSDDLEGPGEEVFACFFCIIWSDTARKGIKRIVVEG